MPANTSSEDDGSSLRPLSSTQYGDPDKVAEYLLFPDIDTIAKFKADWSIQKIFHDFYDQWVKADYNTTPEDSDSRKRRRREKNIRFKTIEDVLIEDDNGRYNFKTKWPIQENYIDGVAATTTFLVTEMSHRPESPLFHLRGISVHARRCMAWTLLMHMVYEEDQSRKSQPAAKDNTERKDEAMEAGEHQQDDQGKAQGDNEVGGDKNKTKRRKGNSGDDVPILDSGDAHGDDVHDEA